MLSKRVRKMMSYEDFAACMPMDIHTQYFEEVDIYLIIR